MSILIKGMEMPSQGEFKHIRIYDNGDVTVEVEGGEAVIAHAVPVPPHGRLIDGDALINDMANMIPWAIESPEEIAMVDGLSAGYEAVKAAPTIIPAED